MLAQRLDVDQLEIGLLELTNQVPERVEIAVGEDVAADESVGPGIDRAQPGDPVVEEQTAGTQQVAYSPHVLAEPFATDVLVHADARHFVEFAATELAVVGDEDLAAVGDTGLSSALAGELCLGLRQGDPEGARAVPAGCVYDKRTPAATDVQEALAGCQRELATDEVELALLRGFERLVVAFEVGARVDHRRAEDQAVEVVRHVVVVPDRGTVAT